NSNSNNSTSNTDPATKKRRRRGGRRHRRTERPNNTPNAGAATMDDATAYAVAMTDGDDSRPANGDGGDSGVSGEAKKRRRRGGRRHRRDRTGQPAANGQEAAVEQVPAVEPLRDETGDPAGDGQPKKRRRRGGRRHRRDQPDAGVPAVPAVKTPAARQPRAERQPHGRRERVPAKHPRLLPGAADVLAELGPTALTAPVFGEINIAPPDVVIPDMQVRKMSPAAKFATTRPERGPRDFRPQGDDRLRPVLPPTDDFALYAIDGSAMVKRYVASTPETRQLLNRPEIVGGQVTVALRSALARLLARAGQELGTAGLNERDAAMLTFLRGGLAFGLREALTEGAGFNRAAISFMTAERYRDGRQWRIRQDGYRSFNLPDAAQLFIAEVVATGTTLAHGLDLLLAEFKRERKKLRGITLFAIGSREAEEVLTAIHQRCQHEFGRSYGATTVIYLEGRFGLAGSVKSPVISEAGTDLLRFPALLAPEFELAQFERLSYPLERCVIYDLGKRAFNPTEHLNEVRDFWRRMMEQGITCEEAYRERWPLRPQAGADITEEYARLWREVPEATIAALGEARTKLWALLDTEGKSRAALIRACCQRTTELDLLL
ncbi:MAG TPA: hypothetical protein PKM88_14110, partial [bacterium]|nr:hypothetical protein [bacterium]